MSLSPDNHTSAVTENILSFRVPNMFQHDVNNEEPQEEEDDTSAIIVKKGKNRNMVIYENSTCEVNF